MFPYILRQTNLICFWLNYIWGRPSYGFYSYLQFVSIFRHIGYFIFK